MEPLPTPRQFLESLISSLPDSVPSQGLNTPQTQTSTNPLKALDQASRNILITLHVLYPSILLRSLDLLDRGLVTRITQTTEETPSPQDQSSKAKEPLRKKKQETTLTSKKKSIFLVQSAQTPLGQKFRSHQPPSNPNTYTVRLSAWHCSCAAFVFSAFPSNASTFSPSCNDVKEVDRDGVGGMSFDGDVKDGGVAMCKHLLAALLVERWEGVLGGYLKERRVGRNEMAGLGADV